MTLDDDVAAMLRRVVRRERRPVKAIVNEALRVGLESRSRPATQAPFRVEPLNLGGSLIGNLDDIEAVLSRVEGEDHT